MSYTSYILWILDRTGVYGSLILVAFASIVLGLLSIILVIIPSFIIDFFFALPIRSLARWLKHIATQKCDDGKCKYHKD